MSTPPPELIVDAFDTVQNTLTMKVSGEVAGITIVQKVPTHGMHADKVADFGVRQATIVISKDTALELSGWFHEFGWVVDVHGKKVAKRVEHFLEHRRLKDAVVDAVRVWRPWHTAGDAPVLEAMKALKAFEKKDPPP